MTAMGYHSHCCCCRRSIHEVEEMLTGLESSRWEQGREEPVAESQIV